MKTWAEIEQEQHAAIRAAQDALTAARWAQYHADTPATRAALREAEADLQAAHDARWDAAEARYGNPGEPW